MPLAVPGVEPLGAHSITIEQASDPIIGGPGLPGPPCFGPGLFEAG